MSPDVAESLVLRRQLLAFMGDALEGTCPETAFVKLHVFMALCEGAPPEGRVGTPGVWEFRGGERA